MFAGQRTYDTASYAEFLKIRDARNAHKAQKRKRSPPRPLAPPHQDVPGPQARAPTVDGEVDGSTSTAYLPPAHHEPNTSARRKTVDASSQRQERGPPSRARRTRAPDSTSAPVENSRRMISPRPPRSRRVAARHGPPTTADRQIITGSPRSSELECAERKTSAGDKGGGSDSPECDSCGRDLSERASHHCQECSTLVCSRCLVNAAIFHPGHTLRPATAQQQHGQPRRGDIAQESTGHQEQDTPAGEQSARPRRGGIRAGGDGERAEVTSQGVQYQCYFCEKPLLDIRYECQTCSDGLSLCQGCLDVHPRAHLLELFNCGPEPIRGRAAVENPRRAPSPASPRCFFCEELLSGVGYECQTCSLHLCHGHRDIHPPAHQLRAITQRAGPAAGGLRDPSCGRDDGTVLQGTEGESVATVDGLDEADGTVNGEVTTRDNVTRRVQRDSSEEMDESDGDESDGDESPSPPTDVPRRSPRLSQPPGNDHSRLSLAPGDDSTRGQLARPVAGAPRRRESSLVTVTFSKESLLQFARVARAMVRAAGQQAAITDETEHDDAVGDDAGGEDGQSLKDLLDFDLSADVSSPEPGVHRASGARRSQRRLHRRWGPEDKRRLSSLKRQGWDDAEIAATLQRSPGAVAQQWRKQRQ